MNLVHGQGRPSGSRSLALLSILILSLSASAGTIQAAGLTVDQVARLRTVGAAEISPDGESVAYVLSRPRIPFEDDDGPVWVELHLAFSASGQSRPFVSGEINVSAVQWRPDGGAISFLAKRGEEEKTGLYLIPLTGGEARRILQHAEDISAYSWSPDGKRVAFLATEKEDEARTKLEEKGFKAEVYEEQLHPVRIWIAELDPEGETDQARMLEVEGSASELHWSPMGNQLAVALAPTPLIDDHYMKRQVHVLDVESGQSVARIENLGKLGEVRWAPDGSRLAMLAGADLNDPNASRLMVASAEGGEPEDLLPGFEGDVVSLAFRDASTLLFVAHQGVTSFLAEVGVGGGSIQKRLESGGPVLESLSLSDDGRQAAMVADAPQHPRELYFWTAGAATPKRITDSNPWLSEVSLAVQEIVEYDARDGLDLQGLLVRPLAEKQGQRYPLIVVVHGGPEAHFSNGWLTSYSRPGQFAAAEGYAVFYPNYRGSTGRGVAFSKLDQADYAVNEFNDLVDGAKHLVSIGLVDEDKVGVTGGSYGGFASAWCATALTEHFAAAVMFVGISEQISKFGTTDIPNEMFLSHARRWPWDYWDWFRERSPVFYAEQARTPILILHGKEDTRVHPSQSMVLYRYLKTLGNVPVRLVFYPGEGHGNRKAAGRLDYSMRLMRWMNHYLQGPGGEPPPPQLDLEHESLEADDD